MQRRFRIPLLIALASAGLLAAAGSMSAQQPAAIAQQKKLPAQLADSTFWRIISEFSEPEQTFGTYMVSNENFYPKLVADLNALNLRGGAYVGVAPEQNYHYIAALRPEIAFILDIRRQAVMQHMLFKTVFELPRTGPISYRCFLPNHVPLASPTICRRLIRGPRSGTCRLIHRSSRRTSRVFSITSGTRTSFR